MKADFRRLAWLTLIYGSGIATTGIAAFVLFPIYSRVLTPADYGILAVVNVAIGVLTPFLSLGLGSALFRYYYEYETEEEKRLLVRSCLACVLVAAFLIVVAASVSLELVVGRVFTSTTYVPYLRIAIAAAFFDAAQVIPRYMFRIQQRAPWYVAITLISFSLNLALGILFVAVLRRGVAGALYAGLVSSAVSCVLVYVIVAPRIGVGGISIPVLRRCLRFSIPQVPAFLAGWTLNLSNRWFLERYSTATELGLYSLGHRMGQSIQTFVTNPMQAATGPYMYSIASRPDSKRVFARVLTYSVLVSSFIGLLVALNGDNVVRLLSVPPYYRASTVVPLVALAYVLEFANWVVAWGITYAERPGLYTWITVAALVVALALNWLLIPAHGMMGAAYATVVSYGFMFVVSYVVAHRLYPIKYEYGRLGRIVVVALGLFAVGRLAAVDNLALNILLQTLAAFALLPALLATGFFTKGELNTVARAWAVVKARRPWALGRA